MLYVTRAASPRLAPFVESLTLVVDEHYPYAREQLLPDGAVDLLVNLGPSAHRAVLPGGTQAHSYQRAWLSGVRRQPMVIERAAHGYNLLIVRFRPGGATALFDLPMCEVADRVIELNALWDAQSVDDLIGRIAARDSADGKLRELEAVLQSRLRLVEGSRLVLAALQLLETSRLTIGMREIAATLGSSHTRLIRTFEQHVGVKPKLLQRLLRFQRAIALEDARTSPGWSAIAHRCGYADQAHLIREFQLFAGRTPRSYRASRGEWANYIPID